LGTGNLAGMHARTPEELHALIAAALSDGDADAFVALHEPVATIVVPPDGRRVTGCDEIRGAIEPVLALRPVVRIEVVDKIQADGLALTRGDWTLAGSGGGELIEMSGRGTMVSRRQADGSWRIVLDNPLSH
jgi:ketosteroid isomerase-like protein